MRRTKAEMEETISILMLTARKIFTTQGYANSSMEDLTAGAGLTRGALYHHFKDKKSLLSAVVNQIDTEMDARLQEVSDNAKDTWEGFRDRCRLYLEMAQEPEIQRIILRDARAVLGNPSVKAQKKCIRSMQILLEGLMKQEVIMHSDSEALAIYIYGALSEASFWIAESEEKNNDRLQTALKTLDLLLRGIKL